MDAKEFLAVDATGEVINIVLWDGETPYDPGADVSLLEPPGGVFIGWRRNGGAWSPPPSPPEEN